VVVVRRQRSIPLRRLLLHHSNRHSNPLRAVITLTRLGEPLQLLTATGSAMPLTLAINVSNRITTAGFSYDLAGNLTADVTSSYAWNAESEIKTAAGVNYTYDGDGNRVQKSNGKIYWYGAGTEILDESDASGNFTDEYVFFGGKRVAHRTVSSGSITYYAEDFLGSTRVMTTSVGAVCYDADFYPYGGEKVITNTCPQNYKFTGKERDAETGNDDFGARYYSSVYGRWLSPDWSSVPAPVPYANLNNPQTLNLYAMVSDNPETFSDLDGHATCDTRDNGGCNEGSEFIGNAEGWYEHLTQNSQAGATQQQTEQGQHTQQGGQHQLSDKSKAAINTAMRNDPGAALLWGYTFLQAGAKNGVDPNLLVGLAVKESSLNPHEVVGDAKGMFQITPGRQTDLGLSNHDLFNPNVVVNAVAASLASATKTFNGNAGLALASWTVGVAGTRAAFQAHGMAGVRSLLLDRAHPSYGRVGKQYIDFIRSFQSP
jgi:RHS repeat-associated protein